MKHSIIIAAIAVLASCGARLTKDEIDGHTYVIATLRSGYGGVAIVHSESCVCRKR